MKVCPQCFECALKQARTTAQYVTDDENLITAVLQETARRVAEASTSLSPAEFSMAAYDSVRERLGVLDPYLEQKKKFNAVAVGLAERLQERITRSSDPFRTAALLAAAGNVIDLGIGIVFDIETEIERVLREGFAVDHLEAFRKELAGSRTLLYCLDNAGEVVFDRLFVEEILRSFPSLRVTALVKGGPIINDATLDDAREAGLDDLLEVKTTGTAAIGVPLGSVNEETRRLLSESDLILSKGQGNFETLDSLERPFYVLLKAKCRCVAEALGVGEGEVVFMLRKRD